METIYNIIIDIIPLLGIFSFIKAIIEYRKTQLWKESEFLSKEIKEFFSDERVKVVLTLLDWNARKIMINGQEVKVNDDYMIEALKTHNQKSRFSIEEAHIRDLFDNFFDKLAYFNIHCKNGLVSEKKIFNYFDYYFNILTTTERKDWNFIKTIDNYIDYYDYTNVRELLDKYKKEKRDH
jgi:hypothetical protein